MVKTNCVIHDVNKVCILVTFYIDFTFIAIAFIYKFCIWYCRALTLNHFWVSNLIQLLYLLQTFLPYFHFWEIYYYCSCTYHSSTMIMLISLSLVAIFILIIATFLFLCRAVLYVFFEFIFMKFLSDQWARKNYSLINLKGKVIKLVSKIPRKNIHFQWFWWQKQNVKQGVKTEFGLGKTILTPQHHTSCWSCRYRVWSKFLTNHFYIFLTWR